MGIEPTSCDPQVIEITHRASSIWAHLGAQFRPQKLAHFIHCITLTVSDHVTVNPERDSRVRMPQLLLSDFRIRSNVHQHTRVTVPKSVHAGAFDL